MRMQRGYFKRKQLKVPTPEFIEDKTPASCRYKTKRLPPRPNEIVTICHKAIVQKLMYKDIAKEHNVRVQAVSRYVCQAKRNPKYLAELHSKEDEAAKKEKLIEQAIE